LEKFQVKEFGKNNKKVIFLLAGWKNRLWQFWWFSKILANHGFYCLTVTYDDEILSPDVTVTVSGLEEVANSILLKIRELEAEGYHDFSVFGTSLGCVLALMVANQSGAVSKVILNNTGGSVAEIVWSWDQVNQGFKKALVQQGFDLSKLEATWEKIAPENNLDNLKSSKLLVYLAKKDEIIPYYLGEKLLAKLKEQNISYKLVINNTLNHSWTGAANLFNSRIYLDFLKS